jgi:superfamily II DNA or RNA helicase
MPAGLVTHVVRELKKLDPKMRISVVDSREDSIPAIGSRGLDVCGKLQGKFGTGIYDYQMSAAEKALEAKRAILKIATNGGKTAIAAAIINHLSIPTLFVVPGVELLGQTLKSFEDMLGIPAEEIGTIGDSSFSVGEWVTIAIADSLANRLEDGSLDEHKNRWQMLFVDECHTAGAETLYAALSALPAYFRFGLSGTPLDRSDGGTLRLIAQTGEVVYEVRNKLLVERGISVQPLVHLMKVDQPIIPKTRNKVKVKYAEVEDEGYVNNEHLNSRIAEAAIKFINDEKQCIILINKLQQGENILKLLQDRGCADGFFTHGQVKPASLRKEALEKFVSGEYRYLIGSKILDQGIDMDCIDVMFFAGGGKATIPTLQRSGRGLRSGRGRTEVILVDVVNLCHKFLTDHSAKRLQTYKDEECFKISILDESPNPTTS